MKKLTFLVGFLMMTLFGFSQTIAFQEGFETLPLSVTSSGVQGWNRSNRFAKTGTYSDSSRVAVADTATLTTNAFSTTGNSYVVLEFAQICKIEFFDAAIIEVSVNNGATWTKLVGAQYLGAGQFGTAGDKFTSAAYTIWDPSNATTIPQNAWWKSEIFDISSIAANQANVKVRFRLYDGNGTGHANNYGWLLDDIKVTVSPSELIPPVVTLQAPIFQDTVFTTNPYEIKALITDASGIDTAYIVYKINNGANVNLAMTNQGGGIYSAFIPSQSYNTRVDYQVFAADSSPAANLGQSTAKWFYVKKGPDLVTIGTGTTVNTTTSYPAPYGNFYYGSRHQMLIRASELTAAGVAAGEIVSLAFDVVTPNGVALQGFTIKIGATSQNDLSTWVTTSLSTVFTSASYTDVAGWNTHTFSQPFSWNGTSNIVIETCFNNTAYTDNAVFNQTATPFISTIEFHQDAQGVCTSSSTSNTPSQRPNIKLGLAPNTNNYDAGVFQITEPVGTVLSGSSVPVKVRIKNFGIQNLVSAQIGWSINGVSQPAVPWSGSLSQDQVSNTETIGNYTFVSGPYVIKAWTYIPNGHVDEKHINDTITANVFSCDAILNGAYTVGGVSADYTTLDGAITALQMCGISGPVTFNINPGTYNQRIVVPQNIQGISATNTVTFKGFGNSTIINYTPTASSEKYVVLLDNIKHVRFDSLKINIPDTADYGWGFLITNQSEDIKIKNCYIKTVGNSSSSEFAGIVASGSYLYPTTGGNTIKNLEVSNNTIDGGYYGITLSGDVSNKTKGILISNNIVKNIYYYGLYLSQSVAPVITKNAVETNTTGTFSTYSYGIYLSTIDSSTVITKNRVKNVGSYGIYLYSCNSTSIPVLVANNFIGGGFTNTSSPYGLYIGSSSNLAIVYNSINMNKGTGSAFFAASTTAQMNVLNNSFAYTGTDNGYAAYYSSTASLTTNNRNNYFKNTSTNFVYYGIGVANLAALQAVNVPTGNDANSRVGNPNYSTPTSLYPTGTQLWNGGTPIPTVNDDIDGVLRNATTPCIGAVEYTPAADDAALIAVVTPLNSACALTANEDVKLRIKNFGTATMTSVNATYKINNNTPVTETFTVNILMDSIQEITFVTKANLSAAGIYNFSFWVNKVGDVNQLNDSIVDYKLYHSHNFYSGAYQMGFEPSDYYADWSVLNTGTGTTTWVIPYVGETHGGVNSVQFYNSSSNTGEDWLFSRCFDLAAGSTYQIDFYYKNTSTTVSNSIELKLGQQKVPAQMTTSLVALPNMLNTSYLKASQTFTVPTTGVYYFGWRAYSTPSYTYAYIDDINIKLIPPIEASVTEMLKPVSGCGLGIDTVKITIKNTGSGALNTNVNAYYQVNGGSVVSEVVPVNLAVNQTMNYSFTSLVNLSTVNVNTVFNFKAWIALTGDPLQFNDTINKGVASSYSPANPIAISDTVMFGTSASLTGISPDSLYWFNASSGGSPLASTHIFNTPNLFSTTVYYVQAITPGGTTSWNFNTDIQGWTVENPCSSSYTWAWNADGGNGALWASNPSTYSYQLVTSPVTSILGSSSVSLSFNHKYGTESNYDEGYLAYKLDNGPWTQFVPTVNTYNVSQNIDNDPLNSCVSNTKSCYSGTQASYINSSGTITTGGASNIQLAFVFTSDVSNGGTGWFINDVTISGGMGGCTSARIPDTAYVDLYPQESSVISVVTPDNQCSTGSEPVTIKIKNNGLNTINGNLTAYYTLNGGAPVSEPVTATILPADTLTFTFSTPINAGLSQANQDSVFNIKAYAKLTGDVYPLNDTIQKSVTLKYTPALPVATSITIPYATSGVLHATSNDTIKWYNVPVGGTVIGTGANYTTPVLFGTTIYYVEAKSAIGCTTARVPDTVFVTNVPACDIKLEAVYTPNTGIELSANEPVKIKVKNYGTVPAINVPVRYTINGGTPVIDSIPGPIATGDTAIFTFTQTANLSAFATYNFKVYSCLPCDTTHINDTIIKTVICNALVYCTSAASSTGDCDISNVTVSNLNNGAALPVYSNPACVNTYTNFTTLPPVMLIAGMTYPISVSQSNNSTTFWGSLVNVYLDYNRNGVFDLPLEKVYSAPTSLTATTIAGSFTVPTTGIVTGDTLRMRVVLDESDVAPACGSYTWGETEDYSVIISPQIPHDAGVISIVNPLANQAEGDIVNVKVVIKNFGLDTLFLADNMSIKYEFNGGAAVSMPWPGDTLIPFAVDTVTLSSITIPSGNNTICAYTVLTGDSNTINDQTCKAFYALPNYDAGVTSFVLPGTQLIQGSNETVQVVFTNFGSDTLTSLDLVYKVNGVIQATQPWTGTLLPAATVSVTFTQTFVVPTASFSICAYTSLTTDGDHNNDTLCQSSYGVFTSTLPYVDNFDGSSVNWSGVAGSGSAWELGTPSYGTTNSAHSAPNAWDINLSTAYTNNATAYLYTQYFDFSSAVNTRIKFWLNYKVENSYDGLRIDYSTDSSATWTTLGIKNDPNGVNWYNDDIISSSNKPGWTDNSAGWKKSEYKLNLLNNVPLVRFRFVFNTDGSGIIDGFSIDDFSLVVPPDLDAGVTDLVNVVPVMNGGDALGLQVKITNFGIDTLHTIPVKYSVNGGSPVTETWMGNLLPDSTVTYTFSTTFNVPVNQFNICSWTQLTNDANSANDTLCKSAFGVPLLSVPFTDDLEGPANFYIDGLNNQWQHGVPTANVINTAHSPVNVWATNLSGNYANSSNYNLYSPRFSFTGIVNAEIGFWHWYATETAYDGGRLQFSTNNGSTWTTLGTVGDPNATNWYTHNNINGAPAFSGASSGWVYSSYNLAQFNNYPVPVQFRFNFYSNVSNNLNGWAIDDIEIFQNQIAQDAGVIEIVNPGTSTVIGTPDSVKVKIKNLGTAALALIPVRYRVNNNVPVSEQWTGNLAPGDTLDFTFATPVVQTADYTLCAYTKVLNDTYAQNDTTCTSVTITPAQFDAGITEITTPGTSTIPGTPVTVAVKIKNYGTDAISNFPLQYDINAGTPVIGTYSGTINPGAEVTYTFTQTYVSPSGSYQFCSKTNLTTDQNATNDKICKTIVITGIEDGSNNGLQLGQNMPNPAFGNTVIPFSLPANGAVRFEIVDIVGQLVYVYEGDKTAGKNTIEIDANKLTDGVYFYTLTYNEQRLTRKLVVSK